CTAVAATLMQWVVTPILLKNSFERARLQYSHDSAQQLALVAGDDIVSDDGGDLENLVERMGNPLPGGGAAIIGLDGKILHANKHGAEIARNLGDQRTHLTEGAFLKGDARIGIYPIRENSETVAYAMLSMEPKTLISTWVGVIGANALVV